MLPGRIACHVGERKENPRSGREGEDLGGVAEKVGAAVAHPRKGYSEGEQPGVRQRLTGEPARPAEAAGEQRDERQRAEQVAGGKVGGEAGQQKQRGAGCPPPEPFETVAGEVGRIDAREGVPIRRDAGLGLLEGAEGQHRVEEVKTLRDGEGDQREHEPRDEGGAGGRHRRRSPSTSRRKAACSTSQQ